MCDFGPRIRGDDRQLCYSLPPAPPGVVLPKPNCLSTTARPCHATTTEQAGLILQQLSQLLQQLPHIHHPGATEPTTNTSPVVQPAASRGGSTRYRRPITGVPFNSRCSRQTTAAACHTSVFAGKSIVHSTNTCTPGQSRLVLIDQH